MPRSWCVYTNAEGFAPSICHCWGLEAIVTDHGEAGNGTLSLCGRRKQVLCTSLKFRLHIGRNFTHRRPLPFCRCSESPASKSRVRVAGSDGNARIRHGIYSGSGRTSLRPVRALVLLHSVCSRGYKRAREGTEIPSLRCSCACVYVCF